MRFSLQCGGIVAPHHWMRPALCLLLPISVIKQMIVRSVRGGQHWNASAFRCKKEAAMTVNSILSHKGDEVLTIEPTATLAAAVQTLTQRRIGALVVTAAGKRIVGIISERDIVQALDAKGVDVLAAQVSEVMTRKVVTCGRTDTIAEIMEQTTLHKFRHVPVIEQGCLVGIISIGDVVKARLDELVREQDALRDYIRTA
jgi:CBS domain-containing protein